MKTIVLDTNELMRDWTLAGLKYQLFDHLHHASWFDVCVPAIVFEEFVANHERAVADLAAAQEVADRKRRALGLAPVGGDALEELDFRAYLLERFDTRLSFTVLDWPEVPHRELALKAVRRERPFNEKGTGYRDALIWADVVDLARQGRDVALVSMDAAFTDGDGGLASTLRAEVEPLRGSVELVRELNTWLIASLPWKTVSDLRSAVAKSQTAEFTDWLAQSDFASDLVPRVEDLGFMAPPFAISIDDVAWDGSLQRIADGLSGTDGLSLVEYDLGVLVTFSAELPTWADVAAGWKTVRFDPGREIEVEGDVEMTVRVAVLYGGEFGFSVDTVSWRRADGVGPGAAEYDPLGDPLQLHLFGTDQFGASSAGDAS